MCSLLGYEPRTDKTTSTGQQVIVQFLQEADSIDIKLIEPSGSASPLVGFLKKGDGLQSIKKLTDMDTDLRRAGLDKKGLETG